MQDTHPPNARMVQATDITELTCDVLDKAAALRDRIQALEHAHLGVATGSPPSPEPDVEPAGFVPSNVYRLRGLQAVLLDIGRSLLTLENSHGKVREPEDGRGPLTTVPFVRDEARPYPR